MRLHPNPQNGFTLVELIVVIVIVVIGGVLVTNCAQRNRNRGRTGNCASNLRQIGMGIEIYSMDLGHGYPKAASPGNVGVGARSLALIVTNKMLIKPEVYFCPRSDDTPDTFTKTWTDFSSAKNISYGYDPGHSSDDGTDVIVAADYSADGKNSNNHGANPGQNVLFLGDWHVEWVRTPNSGVQDNNIYLDDGPGLPRAKDSIIVR